jgi:Fe-S-cluster containining protein
MIREAVATSDEFIIATRSLVQLIDQGATTPDNAERDIRREVHVMEAQKKIEPAGRIAELLHKRVDRALAFDGVRHPDVIAKVPCVRGCTHCCYQMVSVSEPEAVLAIATAKAAGHAIDYERARRQAPLPDYMGLPHVDRRCVMLRDDGDCAVYAHRPLACRAYRVVTPADMCDIEKHPGGRTLVFHTVQAEVIASASIRAFRTGALAAFVAEEDAA